MLFTENAANSSLRTSLAIAAADIDKKVPMPAQEVAVQSQCLPTAPEAA